ncbi:hypothetical protein E2C01_092918 [Portunus trituberculatus]|uniref:Uncharacterized protein n=1 Tax=Portunus trituberculatus TaxID=210409 RepID=A0A5B7JX85_PORTR|nr:hypothetical protein [Portunus trituberculatus]
MTLASNPASLHSAWKSHAGSQAFPAIPCPPLSPPDNPPTHQPRNPESAQHQSQQKQTRKGQEM